MTPGFQPDELCGQSPDRGDAGGGAGLGTAKCWVWEMLSLRRGVSKGRGPRGSNLCGCLKVRIPQEARYSHHRTEKKPRGWDGDSPKPGGPRSKAGTSPELLRERVEPRQGNGALQTWTGTQGLAGTGSRCAGELGSNGLSPGL